MNDAAPYEPAVRVFVAWVALTAGALVGYWFGNRDRKNEKQDNGADGDDDDET